MIAKHRNRYTYTTIMVERFGPSKLEELEYDFIRNVWYATSVLLESSSEAIDALSMNAENHVHRKTWEAIWEGISKEADVLMSWMESNREMDYAPTDPELDAIELISLRIKTKAKTYLALNENLYLDGVFKEIDIAMREIDSYNHMLTKKVIEQRKKRLMAANTANFLLKTKSKKVSA